MSLFKYSKKRYADGLLGLGTIRIGTLHDYRRNEHIVGVSDPTEGTKSIEVNFLGNIKTSDARDREAFRKFSGQTVTGSISLSPGVTLKTGQASADLFVLCFSSELSLDVLRQFDGSDACVEILNAERFLREVTVGLNALTPVTYSGLHEVSYKSRNEVRKILQLSELEELGTNPALIKESSFRAQKEIRAIWTPQKPEIIKPMTIMVPAAIRFVRDVTAKLA
jgi:hypothetical protein